MLADEIVHLCKEGEDGPAAIGRQFAPDKVKRLDAVCAFIDQRNAHIADKLFDALFAGKAGAAMQLERIIAGLQPAVGQEGFHRRRHQRHIVAGLLFHLLVW